MYVLIYGYLDAFGYACSGWTGSGASCGMSLPRSGVLPGLRMMLLPATPAASAWLLRGEYSRACAALTQPAPLPHSAATLAALRALHPQHALPDFTSFAHGRPGAVPEFEAEGTTRAVQTFRRASAPGPSGLRADHLREALQTAHADEVAVHLTAVCQLLARGEVPAAVSPSFAGAALHALPKKHGGVRPIAAGETLRRLVAKLLCRSVRQEARDLFPLQLGVGVQSGAEAAVHAARQWADRNDVVGDRVLLKVDFSDAFNSVCRKAVLQAVWERLPALVPWVAWTYGAGSRLRFGGDAVWSTRGVQQRTPLPPSFRIASAAAPLDLCFAYLDDEALRALTVAAAEAGLVVQPSKCELVLAAGSLSYADSALFPSAFMVHSDGNFDLFVAAIGSAAHCTRFVASDKVDKASACFQALAELPDAQTALLLLRHTASFCKLAYACRATPPALHAAALAFDENLRGCLEEVVACP